MPDATSSPDLSAPLSPPADLLETLLGVSLTGVILFRPVYAADGAVTDLAYVRLNPAAQRMLGLPACPPETFLTLYPHAAETGIFAFYRDTFLAGQPGRYDVNYQYDGLDNYFHLAGQRSGALLVVSFTDTADHDRTAAEAALRASQARERAALAEADHQRAALHRVLMQAPAMICIFAGPQHVFEFVNPPYQALVGDRPLLGKPIAAAMPELAGQPFFDLLDGVYRTGTTFYASEIAVQLDHTNAGPAGLEERYYNLTYQARRDPAGAVDGILVFAHDVTAQVHARRQVEQLNEALETRVAARTEEARAAQAAAERRRIRLERLFMAAPAAICILDGPELVYELVNPGYQALFPGRQLLGRRIADALPEIAGHGVLDTFRRVYATGATNEEQAILIPFTRPEDGVLEDRYFNYIQQARYDERGGVDGVLVFAFEVTEQVRARQQVQALNEELATLNQEMQLTNDELGDSNQQLTRTNVDLDNFVYTASHDLKAPISNIEGLLLALREELPPATVAAGPVEPILARMLDSVERFKRTIEHLTAVSKLQKEFAPASVAVLLAPVVEGVRLDLAPLLLAAGARLTVDVARCPAVFFPEKNLRSVVYNLLSNAVKYRSPARTPHIDLHTYFEGGRAVLAVHDNGLGIGAAQQLKLFGLFQRLHDHVEGSGIGLYMVKKMVENAGGHIEVRSQEGAGSSFFVYFGGVGA